MRWSQSRDSPGARSDDRASRYEARERNRRAHSRGHRQYETLDETLKNKKDRHIEYPCDKKYPKAFRHRCLVSFIYEMGKRKLAGPYRKKAVEEVVRGSDPDKRPEARPFLSE